MDKKHGFKEYTVAVVFSGNVIVPARSEEEARRIGVSCMFADVSIDHIPAGTWEDLDIDDDDECMFHDLPGASGAWETPLARLTRPEDKCDEPVDNA